MQHELLGLSAPNGVHRLVHKTTNERIGYSIVGVTQGPRALAVGGLEDAESSFDRIAALESIVQLRGHLILAFEEPIFDVTSGLTVDHLYCEPFDGSIFLATGRSALAETAIVAKVHRETYWSVLRLCKSLGMIAGRGVPKSPPREREALYPSQAVLKSTAASNRKSRKLTESVTNYSAPYQTKPSLNQE